MLDILEDFIPDADNNIGPDGAQSLAEALKENTSLTTLNLFGVQSRGDRGSVSANRFSLLGKQIYIAEGLAKHPPWGRAPLDGKMEPLPPGMSGNPFGIEVSDPTREMTDWFVSE